MTDLAKAAREASRAIAKMSGNGRREGSDQRGMAWGDVVAVKGQFVDVLTGGTVSGSLRYTTACDGIAEGDRVLIQHVGREPVVVGIVSKGQSNDIVEKQGDWYVVHYGNLVACWIPAVSPQFYGGNEFVRFYNVHFPVEFSDTPTVQVTKANSANSATELSERIELNGIWTDHAQVKCNAWQWQVPEGETTKFSVLAVGIVQM